MTKIRQYMEQGKNLVIFPFGRCGKAVHAYLRRCGIDNVICSDTYLDEENVVRPDKIGIPSSDICVLLSILDECKYEEIYNQIVEVLPEAIIIDALEACSRGRKTVLDLLDMESRIMKLEGIRDIFGFTQMGGRIDYRLTRLEILSYYQKQEHLDTLDKEQKKMIRYLEEDYLRELPRKFFAEEYQTCPAGKPMDENKNVTILEEDGVFYWHWNKKKIYLPGNYMKACQIAENLYREFFTHHPHNYFDLVEGFTISQVKEGIILCDVGAAEGLFSIMLIDKCKKIYLFENDPYWRSVLDLTFAPYKEKIEIIPLTVGDGQNGIQLDEFFADKEKPDWIKMDIEGYEASALRGMTKMLESNDALTMLICTYHRQDDWKRFYELLENRDFKITSSKGYFWHMPDPMPPFFRHGVMRAVREKK